MDSEPTSQDRYLRVDVTGHDPNLWQRLRPKLIQALGDLLDTVIDPERNSTLRDEARKLSSALLDHVKAQLARSGLENEKIEAEVRKLYAQIEVEHAEARKRHAEADALEFANAIKKLRLVLGGTKAMLIGTQGEEAILFGSQIDEFLKTLSEFTSQ